MKVIILNIRDAEGIFSMTENGNFHEYVDDWIKSGESLMPRGVGIDFPALPDVGDVIPLHFQRDGEDTKPHHYVVLGRVFATPQLVQPDMGPFSTDRFVREVVVFVHSQDDETNVNWGDEQPE